MGMWLGKHLSTLLGTLLSGHLVKSRINVPTGGWLICHYYRFSSKLTFQYTPASFGLNAHCACARMLPPCSSRILLETMDNSEM